MTTTAAMAQTSPRSVVSDLLMLMGRFRGKTNTLRSPLHCCALSRCRISDVWTQRVPLYQRALSHPEFVGVWRRLWLPWPVRRSPQEPTLQWARLDPHSHSRKIYFHNDSFKLALGAEAINQYQDLWHITIHSVYHNISLQTLGINARTG